MNFINSKTLHLLIQPQQVYYPYEPFQSTSYSLSTRKQIRRKGKKKKIIYVQMSSSIAQERGQKHNTEGQIALKKTAALLKILCYSFLLARQASFLLKAVKL